MHRISTVDDVVEALGGDTQVAAWLSISQPAVANWKIRGEIPGGWHLRIYARLLADGFDCDPAVFGLSQEDADALSNSMRTRLPPRPKRGRSHAHV